MPFRSRTITREISAAVAVLAIVALVLLTSWHQAAGLQYDLAKLGYSSTSTWSLCIHGSGDQGDGKAPIEIKCSAAGVGKDEISAIQPGSIAPEVLHFAAEASFSAETASRQTTIVPHVGQARAPPMTV